MSAELASHGHCELGGTNCATKGMGTVNFLGLRDLLDHH